MGIKRKDRSFDDILKDVIYDDIPTEYIRTITVRLHDGRAIEFEQSELQDVKTTSELLIAKGLEEFAPMVADVEIDMDLPKLKRDVTKYVTTLLAKHFDEEDNDSKK